MEDLWIETGRTTLLAQFIQGMIQISAALLKYSQSKDAVARRLLSKGLSKLQLQNGHYLGIDTAAFEKVLEAHFSGQDLSPPYIVLGNSER